MRRGLTRNGVSIAAGIVANLEAALVQFRSVAVELAEEEGS
jgi:hypothetical protein